MWYLTSPVNHKHTHKLVTCFKIIALLRLRLITHTTFCFDRIWNNAVSIMPCTKTWYQPVVAWAETWRNLEQDQAHYLKTWVLTCSCMWRLHLFNLHTDLCVCVCILRPLILADLAQADFFDKLELERNVIFNSSLVFLQAVFTEASAGHLINVPAQARTHTHQRRSVIFGAFFQAVLDVTPLFTCPWAGLAIPQWL